MAYFDELFVQQNNGAYKQRANDLPVAIGYVLQINDLLRKNGIVDTSDWKPLFGGDLSRHFEHQRIAEQKRHIILGTVPAFCL